MQAVLLAAGKGTRMLPLTITTPKPLLEVGGQPIIERIIDVLPEEIGELIIVVGYRGDLIRERLGDLYQGRIITYVEQKEQKGTYDALLNARPHIKGKFILLNSDDLHGAEALADALEHDLAIIASRHEDPAKFGVVSLKEDGTLHTIIEKPEVFEDNLVSTGAMVLDDRIFSYDVPAAPNGEYYYTVALDQLCKDHSVQVIEQPEWIPLGYPEDLAAAELILEARREAVESGAMA